MKKGANALGKLQSSRMKGVAKQDSGEVTLIQVRATLFKRLSADELVSGVLYRPLTSLTRELQQRMSVVFLFLFEFESDRPGNKRSTFFAGEHSLGFSSFELGAGLLAIADRVVGAELVSACRREAGIPCSTS